MKNIVLKLDIKNSQLQLLLMTGRVLIDRLELAINRNMDYQLMAGLDKLFKKNRLGIDSLKKVEISSNVDKTSSYWRIMVAFRKGLRY